MRGKQPLDFTSLQISTEPLTTIVKKLRRLRTISVKIGRITGICPEGEAIFKEWVYMCLPYLAVQGIRV
jgi:hypothetical protein